MRALTLTQPWAGLVASGIKLVENRDRHIVKRSDFGKPFAIHASREINEAVYARIVDLAADLSDDVAFCERARRGRANYYVTRPTKTNARWYTLSQITSSVIAVATIDHVMDPVAHGIGTAEPGAVAHLAPDQRRWFSGPIGYVLRDVVALATPVPCRGWQGFWTLTDEVAAAVEAQLR